MVIARQNHGVPRRARPMGPPAGFLHRFRWNPVKRRPRLSGHSAFGETTRLGARLGRARGVGLVRRKFGAVLCRTERRRAVDENRSSGKPASPISLLVQPVWTGDGVHPRANPVSSPAAEILRGLFWRAEDTSGLLPADGAAGARPTLWGRVVSRSADGGALHSLSFGSLSGAGYCGCGAVHRAVLVDPAERSLA